VASVQPSEQQQAISAHNCGDDGYAAYTRDGHFVNLANAIRLINQAQMQCQFPDEGRQD
jgi:hypothetical protein